MRSNWQAWHADCVISEPLYEGGFAGIPPGSQCIANAYTNNHDLLADKNISTGRWLFLHAVDAVALVHALILRLQALVFCRSRPWCFPGIDRPLVLLQNRVT